MSLTGPFLNTGTITAHFQLSGTSDTDSNCVKARHNTSAKQCFSCLNNRGG